jgi:acyl-CoA-binding protein
MSVEGKRFFLKHIRQSFYQISILLFFFVESFRKAVHYIQNLPPKPKDGEPQLSLSMQQKATFYGLYKQATLGNNNQAKPSWLDPVGRAKWNAWHQQCIIILMFFVLVGGDNC